MKTTEDRKIWVQTYGVSARGAWLNLEDYNEFEEVEKKCAELFGADAEYGVFDYQGFALKLPTESVADAWEWHIAFAEADDEVVLAAFIEARGVFYYKTPSEFTDKYTDAYLGEAETVAEFCEEWAAARFQLPDHLPEGDPRGFIDWGRYWHCYLQFQATAVQVSPIRYMFFDANND